MIFCEVETICTMYKKDLPQNLAKLRDWYERLSNERALKKVNVQFKSIVEQYDLYYNGQVEETNTTSNDTTLKEETV